MTMKKMTVVKLVCVLLVSAMLFGCSSVPGNTEQASKLEEAAESAAAADETETANVFEDKTDNDVQESEDEEDYWKGPDENVWDGGPDFTSLATQFNSIFGGLTIEEAAQRYAINLVDGGKYADYEGDIGEIIPEYKDVDLDGDRKADVIKREGKHYVIECSSAGTFETNDFSSSPNEGEIIEFEDMACRNIDEILIAHYTFGTGGPVVWDTAIYSYQKGKWKKYPLVDEDNNINSQELRDYIAKRTGKKYEPELISVRSADMTTLLLDFGHKDGPEQVNDYEAVYLHRNFIPEHVDDRDDYDYYDGRDYLLLLNHWPLEVTGKLIELTGELQYKLNVYLSNFSEQDYRPGTSWEATMAHFALQWERINNALKPVQKDGKSCYRLSHSDINGILGRYFGANLEEGDFYLSGENNIYGGYTDYTDDDSFYCEPAADGEMYANNAFTVVTSVEGLGNEEPYGYLRMRFTVYRLDEEEYDKIGIGKEQYRLDAAEAAKLAESGRLYKAYDGSAMVESFDDQYWLLDYRINE